MREKPLQSQILATLGRKHWCRAWRNNTGIGQSLDGSRVIAFGLKGSADITGILAGGRRLEVEVKGAHGRQRKEQHAFQLMIEKMGGIYILARSLEDVLSRLRDEGYSDEARMGTMGASQQMATDTSRRQGAEAGRVAETPGTDTRGS